MLWLDDVGWPQDIGALAILDGSALILTSARLGGGVTANRVLAPGLPSRLRAEPYVLDVQDAHACDVRAHDGCSQGVSAGQDEVESLNGIRELLFPLRPRRDGAVYDGFVGNPVADRFRSNSSRSRR